MTIRLLALCLLATAGCATTRKPMDLAWPAPPDVARIKYVDSWVSVEDVDRGFWGGFRRTLLGTRGESRFYQPMGIAVSADGQRVYVADYQGAQVMKVDLQQQTMAPFAPDVGFGLPFNVVLDAAENVYVSDSRQRAVLVLDRGGKLLRQIGIAELERPTGLALDPVRQILYVADAPGVTSQQHRVLAFSLTGQKLRQVGQARGQAPGQYNFPSYLAVDRDGNLLVADSMNFRVQMFSPEGDVLRVFGEPGDSQGTFSRMKGMAFDRFGNLYVADGGHAVVQLFNRDMQLLMWFGGRVGALEYMELPSCLAVDRSRNRIYVCEQGAVPRINVYDLVNTSEQDSIAPSDQQAPPGK